MAYINGKKVNLTMVAGGGIAPSVPVEVDEALSDSSTNPVQNRVVTAEINATNAEVSALKQEHQSFATKAEFSALQQEHQTFATKGELSQAQAGNAQMYATKAEIPTVPTKVSELENDSEFALKSEIATVYRPCGSVQYYTDLQPKSASARIGDVYNVENSHNTYLAGTNFVWTGTEWDALGGTVSLGMYLKKEDLKTDTYLATATQNGVMSATDKAKLDSIEEGAKNYPVATPNNDGLMEASDKEFLKQMYLNCGMQYWAIGEVNAGSNPFVGSIVYTRLTRYRGTVAITATLPSSVVEESSWLVDLDKVQALLQTANPTASIKFKEVTASTRGGWWVSIPNITNYYGNYCLRGVTTETGAFVSRFVNLYAQNINGTETIKTTSGFESGTVIHMEFPVEETD